MPHSPLERLKVDEWERMVDVNIKGVLYGIAAALPHMKRQKAGHIINVSSVAGHKVGDGAVYAATKHAVRALSEGLRQEVKPYNIRTTVISPGAVATELPDSITEADVAEGIHEFYDEYAIPADSFARAVAFAMSQPDDVDINEVCTGRPARCCSPWACLRGTGLCPYPAPPSCTASRRTSPRRSSSSRPPTCTPSTRPHRASPSRASATPRSWSGAPGCEWSFRGGAFANANAPPSALVTTQA